MTERVLHKGTLVYGVADQVTDARKARSGQVRHDSSVYAMIEGVSVITDWVYAITCQM